MSRVRYVMGRVEVWLPPRRYPELDFAEIMDLRYFGIFGHYFSSGDRL